MEGQRDIHCVKSEMIPLKLKVLPAGFVISDYFSGEKSTCLEKAYFADKYFFLEKTAVNVV